MERTEIIISNPAEVCYPHQNVSKEMKRNLWRAVEYETAEISGKMLCAIGVSQPEPVKINPNLTGWYKIFVSLINEKDKSVIFMRLSNDEAETKISVMGGDRWYACETAEEALWKCADMTNQEIIISKRKNTVPLTDSMLAWIRFVPMSDFEVEEYINERLRTDTKRILATHDMTFLCSEENPTNPIEWRSVIQPLIGTDVKTVFIEDMRFWDYNYDIKNSHFHTLKEEALIKYLSRTDFNVMISDLIDYSHKNGLEIYNSLRMGFIQPCSFPKGGVFIENELSSKSEEYRTVDRDGSIVEARSYIYKEIQDYVIERFVKNVKLGFDGISLIWTRGMPYVLFEEPFIELFQQSYPKLDPRELPLSDKRLAEVRCSVITGFMRRLRNRLDSEFDRHIKINVHIGNDLDNNLLMATDVEAWAKEGLIDSFFVMPMRIFENIDDVMQTDNSKLIDLEKYAEKSRNSLNSIISRHPMHIQQVDYNRFLDIAKKYNITAYFDLMYRSMNCQQIKDRVLDAYSHGVENIAIWDVYDQNYAFSKWNFVSKIGHKDNLQNMNFGRGEYWNIYRLISLDGKNVSVYNSMWKG